MVLKHLTMFAICITVLVACAERGKLGIVSIDTPVPKTERIFVATTRQRGETPYDFNTLRTTELTHKN